MWPGQGELPRALEALGQPLYQCSPPTGYRDLAEAWAELVSARRLTQDAAKFERLMAELRIIAPAIGRSICLEPVSRRGWTR